MLNWRWVQPLYKFVRHVVFEAEKGTALNSSPKPDSLHPTPYTLHPTP